MKGLNETITNMYFFKSDKGLKSYCPLKFEWKQYCILGQKFVTFFQILGKNITVIFHWKGLDVTITNMHFFFKSDNGFKSYCPLKCANFLEKISVVSLWKCLDRTITIIYILNTNLTIG